MKIDDPKIVRLREKLSAAQQEFELAVTFHEVWRPIAYDEDLHKRMGPSHATHAFLVIRTALRREMLLALMRLWDKQPKAVGIDHIADVLRDSRVISALSIDRAGRLGLPESEPQMREDLGRKADAAVGLIAKYSRGGSEYAVRSYLRILRNERLAHRQTDGISLNEVRTIDQKIKVFYQETSEISSLLLSFVLAHAYQPSEAGKVYGHYARIFWAGIKGERTEGHPNYRL